MEGSPMPDGSYKPGVFVFRSLDDCREIAEYANGKKSAAVIGGGLPGLEAARGLHTFGLQVSVVHLAGHLPNWEIAAGSGLTTERGIVVDDQMRCIDDREISAAGERAQHRGRTYGLVAPLWEQAKVLADHITGKNSQAAYHGSKIATK
jgi:nitrite reductase (NADH) large subunit